MSAKILVLESLARDIVGDGVHPNIFVISQGAKVVAVLVETVTVGAEDAIRLAEQFPGPVMVEDRLTGVVWENGESRLLSELAEKESGS